MIARSEIIPLLAVAPFSQCANLFGCTNFRQSFARDAGTGRGLRALPDEHKGTSMIGKPLFHPAWPPAREPDTGPRHLASARDPCPDDLGHEGFVSNIKGNTTDSRERVDRGD